ncbi:MAG TPA: radical SAM protein [Pseudomonadota bacterium]|nr:radical SAM protein [Pseudomonadota bacterium]HNF99256.1 radical SAM protein [Pseudomonadota bacterium]HNI58738.1 radical SAM protein [Pseudomonadota bacterium]HNK45980.1 radical SAM protein [Pseudomonadota bacterium]HNN53498.1 radical SAM protein [Pseudomonadota bacterium]
MNSAALASQAQPPRSATEEIWRRNRQQLVDDMLAGKTQLLGKPVHLKLELTNYCNLSCPMCPHQSMQRPVGYMSPALFRRIISQAVPELEFAYVHHLGESLFHGRIGELIAYGARAGVSMGLSTNATFLDERKALALLDSGLRFLVISLDANSPQSYEKMRSGGEFQKTVRNIERLLELRPLRSPSLHVVVQLIISAYNQHEVSEFARRWPNEVVIKEARDWAGQVSLSSLLPRSRALGQSFPLERPQVLPMDAPSLQSPCRLPFGELTVLWDGKVVPCANVFEHVNLLGDLSVQSLDEVWNGAPIMALRQAHHRKKVAAIPVCRSCAGHALDPTDFVSVDQLSQRLRNYQGGQLSPRSGLS